MSIITVEYAPGGTDPVHTHDAQALVYVLEGSIHVYMREPKEDVLLKVGESFTLQPRRPHLVTNAGDKSATFLILQGIGEYDFVPLT